MRRQLVALGTALATVCSPAFSQIVVNASMATGQPTISRDDKGFAACGIRVVAQVAHPKYLEVYDFSINLNGAMVFGLLKAGKYTVAGDAQKGWDIEKRVVPKFGPKSFWFASQSQDKQLKPSKYMSADDKGFTLGVSDFSDTADILYPLMEGHPVQFALRYPADKMDRIIMIKAEMDQDDKNAFSDCMTGLERRLTRSLEAPPTK